MTDDNKPITSHEPMDRLTGLCAEMVQVLDAGDNDDVKAIVFLTDSKMGGAQVHGYEDQNDALVDLFLHLKKMFEAQGKTLDFIGVDDDGVQRL